MRLSDWRSVAPAPGSLGDRVLGTLESILVALGCEPDPQCWIAWGDDPASRYTVLALGEAGLAVCHVRVNVPQEGPRASGKLVRWGRVQVGELSVEHQGGHTHANFQVEGQVLRGIDAEALLVTEFARQILAGVDGRSGPAARPAGLPALPPPGTS